MESSVSDSSADLQVLRDAGKQTIDAEWSVTASALHSSHTTSSNSYINIETLKECCADTLKDKEDFMVLESSSSVVNISKFNANDTQYSECKTTAFQKKLKPLAYNVSRCFENILDDDSQMEITQNSICLNRFQKRKRLMPPNDEDFIEINNSNHSGSNSVEVSMMKSPKFCFSRKKKDQFEIPDYSLSATDSDSIAGDTNISKRTNTSNFSLVVDDSSNNMKNVSKTEVFTKKFSLKSIGVVDSAFENIINNSSIISDITLNNKKTSLNETSLSNVSNTSDFSKMDLSNLNHTYDIPNSTNSTLVKAPIAGDVYTPKVNKNTVFKKPSNVSILVNDSSNNIMDVSKTEVFTQKFSRKSISLPDTAFDNIIDDSNMTSDSALNNKKSSSNETSVSSINNSKMDMSNLNYTYDIPTHINTSSIDVCIADDANIPSLKQNTVFQKASNSSILVNDRSNNIMDVSKTEVLTHKFSRKTIDVTHSVFENIINNSSITSNITVSDKNTNSTETPVSNVNNSLLNTINMSNLNHTYDIPTIIDVSIAGDANTPKVKQNTDLKKSTNSSFVINDSSNNIVSVSKTEVFTHKFSRKTIDVTHSVFENIINDSSITSDITLSDKNTNSTETPVSNVNNTPVFGTMDVSNLNHTCDVPINNNTTLLDAIVEHDKSMSETPVLLQNNKSKSFNLLPLKFNFSKKIGRHSLSLQENCPNFGGVKKHNISLNSDFSKNDREESTSFHKFVNNSNRNLMSHPHISIIQENDNSSQKIQPLDNSLLTNTSNQEQLKSKRSICSNSNNEDLLSNTTTRSLENNEFQKTQLKHSTSSTSSNEDLILLNSTTGFLGSCSSSRTQSRLLTSKQSEISTSNNDTLNLSIESLDSNESQNQSNYLPNISIKTSANGLILDDDANNVSKMYASSSKLKNKSHDNEQMMQDITDGPLVESRPSTARVLRSSLRTNKNKSLKSDSNVNNLSISTTRTSNNTANFGNNSDISLFWTTLPDESTNISNTQNVNMNTFQTPKRNKLSIAEENDNSSQKIQPLDNSLLTNTSNQEQLKSKRSICSNSNNEDLLSNTTTRSLENNEFQKTQLKHSTSSTSSNEDLIFLNSTTGFLGSCSSSRTQSRLLTSKQSEISTSNNDSLNLSIESLDSNESQNQSNSLPNISIKTSTNGLILDDDANNISKMYASSSKLKNKSHDNEQMMQDITDGSLVESRPSTARVLRSSLRTNKNKSVKSDNNVNNLSISTTRTSNNTANFGNNSDNSLFWTTLPDESTNISKTQNLNMNTFQTPKRNKLSIAEENDNSSQKIQPLDNSLLTNTSNQEQLKSKRSICSNSNNEDLLSNTTTRSLENNEFQKTQLKHSTSSTSSNEDLIFLNSTTGFLGSCSSSRTQSRLLTSKKLKISTSNNDALNLSIESLDNNESQNQSNSLPNISIKTSANGLILDDDANNVSKMYASSSKLKNKSHDNEQMIQDITVGPLVESRPSTARVLRSSLRTNKNKSLKSDNNVNNLSISTTRTSNNTANFDNNSDNSLFWTTLPDESTNISNTQNVNMNTFQTPKRNKLSIAENIANTIKIMSTNNQKSTHPGVFELDDHNDGPLTKSFVTRSYNRSPSILTLVFNGQKPSESISSLTQSPPEIIFDQTQVEENVTQKFKSLYKKESWITKRLYKFLIMKFQPNYNIYSVKYAEKFVKYLARLLKQICNDQVNLQLCTDMLRYHMARYHIIKDTFDYLGFLTDYIPMQYYKKLVPGWNLETSAVKFDPQKYYIPLMDDEEFLNYIMEHLNEA